MITKKVHGELTRHLIIHNRLPNLVGAFYGAGWLLLVGKPVPAALAFSWLGSLWLLSLVQWGWFHEQTRSQGWQNAKRGMRISSNFLICSGCMWGIGLLIFAPYQDDAGRQTLFFLVMGLLPFTLLPMQSSPKAFAGFIVPVLVATLYLLVGSSPQEWLMAMMLASSIALIGLTLHQAHTQSVTSLVQRFTKEQLANELLQTNRQIQADSERDGLTGLYNRATFEQRLETAWRHGCRSQTPLCLLMIDVDFFKAYNDHYGHVTGDQCLRVLSDIFRNALFRGDDIAGRYGGEEFVVLLPNSDTQSGLAIAKRITQTLADAQLRHEYSKTSRFVTCSIGLCCLVPQPKDSCITLAQKADEALYQAKSRGRNQVVVAPRGE